MNTQQPQRNQYNRNQGRAGHGRNQSNATPSEFFEKVVQVNRVSKKTKGGDKRSLSVLVVVGDRNGKVGVGLGKAAEVQSAVRKATLYAKKHFITVPIKNGRTIPHQIYTKLGAAKLLMKPAPEGTGVIAGGPARVVVEAAGIKDIVTKSLGTKNKASNVYVALEALSRLKPMKNQTPPAAKADESVKKEAETKAEAEKVNKVSDDKKPAEKTEKAVKKEETK